MPDVGKADVGHKKGGKAEGIKCGLLCWLLYFFRLFAYLFSTPYAGFAGVRRRKGMALNRLNVGFKSISYFLCPTPAVRA